jgi:hypothetical protein
MAIPSRSSSRLNRLESICARSNGTGVTNDGISVSEELVRDDENRLAGFLLALDRAGFLREPPDPQDTSQLATFLRAAWADGLVGRGSPTEAPSARPEG